MDANGNVCEGCHRGFLQARLNYVWGYVCDDRFPGQRNALVACRELGYNLGQIIGSNNTVSEANTIYEGFDCKGDEEHLEMCPLTSVSTCAIDQIVYIVCMETGNNFDVSKFSNRGIH